MTVLNASHPSHSSPHSGRLSADYLIVPGRVLMSVIFLTSGIAKLTHLSAMAQMVHLSPALLGLAGAVEVAGGVSLLLGLWSRLGALGLFLFLIPTTVMFHNFWAAPADHQMEQQVNFMKNLAIMGGLLVVAAHGAGPLSIDAALRGRAPHSVG